MKLMGKYLLTSNSNETALEFYLGKNTYLDVMKNLFSILLLIINFKTKIFKVKVCPRMCKPTLPWKVNPKVPRTYSPNLLHIKANQTSCTSL